MRVLTYIYNFLATHDFPTLLSDIHKLEWGHVAANVYTWLIILPVLIYLFWTKKYKLIAAIASLFLFLLLVQKTFAPGSQTISLHNLLIFLSGAIILVGLNIYLFFVRE